ncbi:Histone-lysine N-methyltransferase smyd1 [Paramarasmius palmivorus]|uniref:Histone-lysine N-methyltransferase smyd1 n=1 Tax=Paramarasmius palmivorus TaxID=297713 RepID=A0AAW0AUC2_9AGAR
MLQSRIDRCLGISNTKSHKEIVKDENLLGNLSYDLSRPKPPLEKPWEQRGITLLSLSRIPLLHRNQHNSPDAYKLLASYRPNSNTSLIDSERTVKSSTCDRATAVKRYREALDLAAKYPQYDDQSKPTDPWERHVISREVQQIRDNITVSSNKSTRPPTPVFMAEEST